MSHLCSATKADTNAHSSSTATIDSNGTNVSGVPGFLFLERQRRLHYELG